MEEPQDQNPFALSTGDMMSALMFIFVLLLSALMLNVQRKAEDDKKITDEYHSVKEQLVIDLREEFGNDLDSLNAEIDSVNMSVIFCGRSVNFGQDSSEIRPRFKQILSNFYPRFIKLIRKPEYIDHIEEIRIEGHTSSEGSYEHNMELSQDRTRAVLNYCLRMENDPVKKEWAKQRITANGLSFSHLILDSLGNENVEKSRRVEFRIRTDAEKQLERIAEELK